MTKRPQFSPKNIGLGYIACLPGIVIILVLTALFNWFFLGLGLAENLTSIVTLSLPVCAIVAPALLLALLFSGVFSRPYGTLWAVVGGFVLTFGSLAIAFLFVPDLRSASQLLFGNDAVGLVLGILTQAIIICPLVFVFLWSFTWSAKRLGVR